MIQATVGATFLRDTKWADGLRGIASLFVVSSHLTLAYAQWLCYPVTEEHGKLAFYNLPVIRVFAEGLPWVSIFMMLTGFVNALKPISLARAGRVEAALGSLASSCFRRTSRLVLPCTIATFFTWILCEFGAFRVSSMVESTWLRSTSPPPSGSVLTALYRFFRAIFETWATRNYIEPNQWVMPLFLKGSLLLYVSLLALVRARSGHRMLVFGALFAYNWATRDILIGMNVSCGAIIAELSMEPAAVDIASSRRLINRVFPLCMVVTGLFLFSYPGFKPEWQPWSNGLWNVAQQILPGWGDKEGDAMRLWGSLGSFFMLVGITLSDPIQGLLSHPILLFLGNLSFPIYLIHGPLLRLFLNWILYAFVAPREAFYQNQGEIVRVLQYPIPPAWKFLYALPVFFVVLIWLAHLWVVKIEPQCAAATKWLENAICGVEMGAPIFTQIPLREYEEYEQESASTSHLSTPTLEGDGMPR